VAAKLQEAGMICYRRGHAETLQVQKLPEEACPVMTQCDRLFTGGAGYSRTR
jgi:hypothetical protein